MKDWQPSSRKCPKCGSTDRLRYQWKPDLDPVRERLRCYDCGYDSKWQLIVVLTKEAR